MTINDRSKQHRRLLGATPPPAPSVATLPQPAPSALPPGIPQELRPSAFGLTPKVTDEHAPPPSLLNFPAATNVAEKRTRLTARTFQIDLDTQVATLERHGQLRRS